MSETQYADVKGHDLIIYGPGGWIRPDAQQNQALLEQIARIPILEPKPLFQLAQFYESYPTNVALGQHLKLVAASNLAGKTVPEIVLHPEYSGWADDFEDNNLIFGDHKGSDPAHERTEGENIHLSVRSVPFEGIIHLLIETITFIDQSDHSVKNIHFVIGVSPAPDSLPPVGTSTTVK